MRDALIYDYSDKPLGISLIFGSFIKIVDVFSLMIYDLSSNNKVIIVLNFHLNCLC